jgi:hypothetical protein
MVAAKGLIQEIQSRDQMVRCCMMNLGLPNKNQVSV